MCFIFASDKDVNECADADFCDNDGQCTNLPGSFQCACGEGFTGVRCESGKSAKCVILVL